MWMNASKNVLKGQTFVFLKPAHTLIIISLLLYNMYVVNIIQWAKYGFINIDDRKRTKTQLCDVLALKY